MAASGTFTVATECWDTLNAESLDAYKNVAFPE